MKRWLDAGAKASDIKTPGFVNALFDLKADTKNGFIFIEEPFGRCRGSMSSLIDYVVLLDMPMEVCLSRVVMRNIKHPKIDSLNSIPSYLSVYNDHLREIYIETTNQVREDSDLIIREVASIDLTIKYIRDWLIGREN